MLWAEILKFKPDMTENQPTPLTVTNRLVISNFFVEFKFDEVMINYCFMHLSFV